MQQYDFLLGTVRFDDETYKENLIWKDRKRHFGSAYGFDKPLSKTIPQNKKLFIIEMNNTQNLIMGIGFIENYLIHSNRSKMYKDERRNQYIYKSKFHINRNDIIKNVHKGTLILEFLENMLFRGAGHFKRGQGCLILPWYRISIAGQNTVQPKRVYRCSICGLKSKNHVCPGKRVKIIPINKKCKWCGKTKHNHTCTRFKKNEKLEKYIYNWFNTLFNCKD